MAVAAAMGLSLGLGLVFTLSFGFLLQTQAQTQPFDILDLNNSIYSVENYYTNVHGNLYLCTEGEASPGMHSNNLKPKKLICMLAQTLIDVSIVFNVFTYVNQL